MHVEQLTLTNFRCFGPNPTVVDLSPTVTTFIGLNGAGKTSVLHALQRLFGVTGDQRRFRRHDFHVPASELAPPSERALALEAILAFPELDDPSSNGGAVPEFFQQMAADADGRLKCRLRLEATWVDDGSIDGSIDQKYFVVRAFGPFGEADCVDLKANDRARIQLVYVPASRDGSSQLTSFLRGRLWRAINWSTDVRGALTSTGGLLNRAFLDEPAVGVVAHAVSHRWAEINAAGTNSTPVFRPIDIRFQEFIRKVEVAFQPGDGGRERALDDLSDGQRSLFHLAMTAAALDIEGQISSDPVSAGFRADGIPLPALTMIAVEEPENNLSPFYLSRIVEQLASLSESRRTQAVISSHSPSVVARVEPEQIRHFRLDPADRTAQVRAVELPAGIEEAAKYVREAVHSYPELYFARFVILGEGASEEVVLPRIAEAIGLRIDQSFVAVVPLGGRHVNHLWRLLRTLNIPHATLLDLDCGREGGGWGRIKTACEQLLRHGETPQSLFGDRLSPDGPEANLRAFDACDNADLQGQQQWALWLRQFHVYFCAPLDLDYSMLAAFANAYQVAEPGRRGPSPQGNPRDAVLGDHGRPELYPADTTERLRWYRYLFLGRGKPSTHVRVLSGIGTDDLAAGAPEELVALLRSVNVRLYGNAHRQVV